MPISRHPRQPFRSRPVAGESLVSTCCPVGHQLCEHADRWPLLRHGRPQETAPAHV
jgi:hypothetical protein